MFKLTGREILKREFRKLLTREILVYFIGAPLLAVLVFGFLYARRIGREYPIIVADEEKNAVSRLASFYLDSAPELDVVAVVPSLDEALREMKNGGVAAVVWLQKDLYKKVLHKKPQPAYVFVDSRNLVAANSLFTGIAKTLGTARIGAQLKLMDKYFPIPDRMDKIVPVRVTSRSLGNPSVDYFLFVLSAVFLLALQQGILVGSCIGVARENEMGLMTSLATEYGGGVRYYFYRHLAVFTFNLPFILMVTALFHIIFSVTSRDIFHSMIFILLFCASVVTFSQVLGTIFRTRLMVLQVLFFYTLPVFFISGYTFPNESMHPVLRFFAALLPTTPALNAFPRINHIEGAAPYLNGYFIHQTALYLLYLGISFLIVPIRRTFSKPIPQAGHEESSETQE